MGGASNVVGDALGWTKQGSKAAIAVVVGTRRSAPRPIGTKMAIGGQGEISGAVSGGCVEGAVIVEAEQIMQGDEPRLISYGFTDEEAWDVGLQCGGEIDVWIEPYRPDLEEPSGGDSPHALNTAFAELQESGGRGSLVTAMDGSALGKKLLVLADGSVRGTTDIPELDTSAVTHARKLMWEGRSVLITEGERAFFVDVTAPLSRLFIFGAVDYAAALCRLARASGWLPYVIDPRSRFAQPVRFPDAEAVVAEWPEIAFEQLGGVDRATAIVVLTHDPKLDDAALHAALASEATYIGAMGSRNAQKARRERLIEGGITPTQLDRIHAPVGLDLGAVTPEETALSILSEIVASGRGREGGRLAHSKHRIHNTAGV
ncbi:MAG: XdhC family protein [Solirubrobacterales bacterium]|nr:XdhC family protein [Solirubrobacterales bacterium]